MKKVKLNNFEKKNWLNTLRRILSRFCICSWEIPRNKEGPLTDSGKNLVESSEGMSELFNETFGKVFTKESLNDISEAKWANWPTRRYNKKLCYHGKHSASVVLSWCTYLQISTKYRCRPIFNHFYVMGPESYRIR